MNFPKDFNDYARQEVLSEKGRYGVKFVFGIFEALLAVLASYTLRILIDDVLINQKIDWLVPIQLAFIAVICTQNFFAIFGQFQANKAAVRITAKLRNSIVDRFFRGDYSKVRSERSGDISSSIMHEANGIMDFFDFGATGFVLSITKILVTIAAMLYISPILTLITVPIVPFVLILFNLLEKKIGSLTEKLIEKRKGVSSVLSEITASSLQIRAGGMQTFFSDRFSLSMAGFAKRDGVLRLYYFFFSMASWVLVMVPYQALMYGVAGWLYLTNGSPSIGLMLVFANFSNYLLQPLQVIANYKKQRGYAEKCYNSLKPFLDIPDEATGNTKPQPAANGIEIKLKDLKFSYSSEDNQSEAKEISFKNAVFAPGTINLIKGASGSGKSTLLSLIFGLYTPTGGSIDIDRVPLKNLDIYSFRNLISYIPQEPVLFNGSVGEYLAASSDIASSLQIQDVLTKLGLIGSGGSLNDGVDTQVGELGRNLSVGQKQRVVIAAGLLKESRIFIFDEPNSGLDRKNSGELIELILELKKTATIIITSHDPFFEEYADQIYKI